MCLIVVPLPTSPDVEEGLCSTLFEMARALRLDIQGSQGTRLHEMFRIVPYNTSRWPDIAREGMDRDQIILDDGDGYSELTGLAARLRKAITEALGHIALRSHSTGDRDTSQPLAIIVPVLVLSQHEESADTKRCLAALGELRALIERTISDISATGFGGSRLASSSFRFLPWIYAATSFCRLPKTFFDAPERMGRSVTPILYSSLAENGHTRPWLDYGRTRLLTDLLALQALSADADYFRGKIAVDPPSGSYYCLNVHSSLFQYPLEDILREKILCRLSAGPEPIVPRVERIGDLDETAEKEVKQKVDGYLDRIGSVVRSDEVDETAFHFHRQAARRGVPIARALDFRVEPTRHRMLGFSVERQVDRLHTSFMQELERCAKEGLESEMRRALTTANQEIDGVTTELEKALHVVLSQELDSGIERQLQGREITAAVRRVAALMRGVSVGLEKLGQEIDRAPEKPESIIEEARARRESWNDGETRLWSEADRLPHPPLIRLSSTVAGLAVLLSGFALATIGYESGSWQRWTAMACSALLAGVTLWGTNRFLFRKANQYLQRWLDFGEDLGRQANGFGVRLARIANHRIRQVKYTVTTDLRRALDAAFRRFVTELAGFHKLIVEEVAERSLQKKLLGQQPEALNGRFMVKVDQDIKVQVDLEDLCHQTGDILKRTLKLKQMPDRVPVEEHQEILRRQGRHARDADPGVLERFRKEATELLRRSIEYGFDASQLSSLGHLAGTGRQVKVFISGSLVRERLDPDQLLRRHAEASTLIESDRWVGENLPAEVAVALTLRYVEVPVQSEP
jgi:hypothetical protein